jgi:3-phenylpropionate/trans-cinnamate dioxygenase ferredoxin component
MSFVDVAKTSEVSAGNMKGVTVGDREVLITNINGHYYAIGGKCTHAGGNLSKGNLEGIIVTCPRHGSKFDVITGTRIAGPAKQDEPSYEVRVDGQSIKVNV